MLVKFERNCMSKLHEILSFLTKNGIFKNYFWQNVGAILENDSVAGAIVNAELLISRLPSFSVPKITVVWRVQPG